MIQKLCREFRRGSPASLCALVATEAPLATVAPLPADAVLARATDAVFAHNHRAPTTALDGAGEVEGLDSGQSVIPQLFSF